MMLCRFFILAILHLNCSTLLLGGVIRSDVEDAEYLALAEDPRYASVGRFWENGFGGVDWFASAVLIHPNWILTAGHAPNFAGSTNVDFEINDNRYPFGQIIRHPSEDLAIVELTQAVRDVEPARLYTGSDEVGRIGTLVGFGDVTDSSSTHPVEGSNRGPRRAGQNVIDGIRADFPDVPNPYRASSRQLLFDFDYPDDPSKNLTGSDVPLELEYVDASGDSGGGLFVDIGDETYLVGISSDGNSIADVPDRGLWSGYVRLSEMNDWVTAHVPLVAEPDNSVVMLDCSGDADLTIEDANCSAIDVLDELLAALAPVSLRGDADGDGVVGFSDFLILSSHFGMSGEYTDGDFDLSGSVQFADFLVLSSNFGQSGSSVAAVPEPNARLILLPVFVLVVVRIRSSSSPLRSRLARSHQSETN